MLREITMGNGENKKTIAFLSNGVTPLFYKQVFKRDLLQSLTDGDGEMTIASDKIPELAYIMAKQAEKANMMECSFEGYIEWLEGFEPLDLIVNSTKIADVYISDSLPSVNPKKNGKGKQNG